MITAGFILRHSTLPRPILAVMYLAMGGALTGSSLHYIAGFCGMRQTERPDGMP